MYDKVKALAESKGITIAALEKQAGLSNGTIGKWKESSGGVRIETVKAVADALGVSIEELI